MSPRCKANRIEGRPRRQLREEFFAGSQFHRPSPKRVPDRRGRNKSRRRNSKRNEGLQERGNPPSLLTCQIAARLRFPSRSGQPRRQKCRSRRDCSPTSRRRGQRYSAPPAATTKSRKPLTRRICCLQATHARLQEQTRIRRRSTA